MLLPFASEFASSIVSRIHSVCAARTGGKRGSRDLRDKIRLTETMKGPNELDLLCSNHGFLRSFLTELRKNAERVGDT